MKKKRVLHILDSLCWGGREDVVINLCNSLDEKKYQVSIITLCNTNNVQLFKVKPHINVVALPISEKYLTGLLSVFYIFKGIPLLISKIKKQRPDVIHSHSYLHRLLFVSIAIRFSCTDSKHFHSVHTSGMYFNPKTFKDKVKLRFEKFALRINKPNLIAISPIVYNVLWNNFKMCSSRITCINNGIDLTLFTRRIGKLTKTDFGFKKNDIIITYVARLVDGKNHLTLLKAIKHLCSTFPNIILCLVGDGELRASLQKFIWENNIQNNIKFLGAIRNVSEVLEISDIGVFPSEFEGMPLALIEMMSMELPIIVSDIPIFRQIIDEGVSGFFFPVFDYQALAEKLKRLVSDFRLRLRVAENAHAASKCFSLERMAREHEVYYES